MKANKPNVVDTPLPLTDILGGSLASENQSAGYLAAIKYALDTDPEIVSKRRGIEAKLASVGVAEAQKDFQVETTLYGGIEDITDGPRVWLWVLTLQGWFLMVVN